MDAIDEAICEIIEAPSFWRVGTIGRALAARGFDVSLREISQRAQTLTREGKIAGFRYYSPNGPFYWCRRAKKSAEDFDYRDDDRP